MAETRRRLQDYHNHSTYSDGRGSIKAIADHCASVGCTEVAITDHVYEDPELTFGPGKPLETFLPNLLKEVQSCKGAGVTVHAGIEIMTETEDFPSNFSAALGPFLDRIEIVIIDGQAVEDPVATSVHVLDILKHYGRPGIPVVIAHPDYETVLKGKVKPILEGRVALELNESKFSPWDAECLERFINGLRKRKKNLPRFTLGSDAHAPANSGVVDRGYKFLADNDLLDARVWL